MRLALPLLAPLAPVAMLGACATMTVPQAEAYCLRQARLAAHPRGAVSLGLGSRGAAFGEAEVEISSDYLLGRDPSQVFATCVQRNSGAPPSRPLYDRPDWKG